MPTSNICVLGNQANSKITKRFHSLQDFSSSSRGMSWKCRCILPTVHTLGPTRPHHTVQQCYAPIASKSMERPAPCQHHCSKKAVITEKEQLNLLFTRHWNKKKEWASIDWMSSMTLKFMCFSLLVFLLQWRRWSAFLIPYIGEKSVFIHWFPLISPHFLYKKHKLLPPFPCPSVCS